MRQHRFLNSIFSFKILFFLFVSFLVLEIQTLSISDTKISTTRDSNRASLCNYFSASYSLDQREQSKIKVQQYNYLSDQDIQQILTSKKYTFNSLTVAITLPFIISAAILLFLIPPLFCCCVWPEKHPICKTWRKSEKQMYTKCELKWPAYFALIFYIIVCVGGLIGLIDGPTIIKKYNDVGCKNAAIFDDIINGRISGQVDGKFFVGLTPLSSQLTTFSNSKISTFYSDSSNALSTANQVRSKQSIVESTIQTTYSGFINSVYSNAFSSDGSTYYNVNSAFQSMYLGPSSDSTKILGVIKSNLNIIFNQINGALDVMISSYNSIQTTTQLGVQSQITSFINSVTDFNTKISVYLNDVGAQYSNNKLYDQLYAVLSAYYGIVFAFALLGFVGSILITFCTVVRARLILYFTCGVLVFFALIGFAFLIYLIYMYPQMNQICHYVDQRLTSGVQTKGVLQKMGYFDFAAKISQCMNDGSGKLIDTFNSSFSDSFDQINVISQGTLTFDNKIPNFTQQNFDNPFNTTYSTIQTVKNAQLWDINDQTAIGHVNKIFGKNYTLGVTCNTVAINGDVWMPSFNLYTCPAGKAKMPVCSDLSSQTTCPLGCYEILNEFVSPSGDPSYTTNLATRYDNSGGTTCNYYQYIVNLHNNWNVVRMSKMDSLNGSIVSLKTIVDDYSAKVSSVKANIDSFKTTLEANFDSMTNLTSGSFNGVDCTVIGESIWQFRDSYCIGLVESVRYNIICLCLICFGILLLSCCVTCTGVRHLKHLQRLLMHSGYKGTPIQLSNTTIIIQK